MIPQAEELQEFQESRRVFESYRGIILLMVTRYDGWGNHRVWFEIDSNGLVVTYDKYNSAAMAFNIAANKKGF